MSDSPQTPNDSPLSEADPTSLNVLFSRDPETYQRQELSQIIAILREQRLRHKADALAAPPKAPKGTKTPKAPVEKATIEDLFD